ncbi:class I SAM-dependent methyltransferase [Geothrix fuzhouensis]|uniref:class I SAM-dependent methyltransferase n=1 Tax=Geothrix fuzhouensis TaxID=2966451 RepID=UPI002148CBE7|nr:methyltransferase domain-containing protein [Geothrix fuzhouensis]
MAELSPDQVAENWGAIASDYERAFEGLSGQFAAHALRLLGLRRDDHVLDVAAGTGVFSLMAARAGAKVLATDFAPGMVARLRERIAEEQLSGISAEVMDGQALAIPDGAFDAGASVLGLIFFPDQDRGLAELRRVLRRDGRAAVVCWRDPATLQLMTLVKQAVHKVVPEFQSHAAPPAWARLAGAEALKTRMEAAGFREVAVVTSKAVQKIDEPEAYWSGFTRSAPPLAHLFGQLGPEVTAAVGREYIGALRAQSRDGLPTLTVEACIGLGRA